MKKRIISVLLLCCIVLGLLPTTTFANNGGAKAIQLGTSGISGYDSTNSSYDYIHFGTWNNSTVKWRVLDTKTNMANAQQGDGFFLLSDVLLGTGEYGGVEFDYTTPYFNDWKGSRGKDWCNDFYSRSLSTTEQKAVLATSKSDDLYGMYYDASDNILDGDKVFFLSAEEAENAAYGFTDDNARIANYGDSAGVWWLRSPRRLNPDSAGTVNKKGAVIGEWVGQTNAARPAFNLKSDSVLLVSAAVGGKGAADGMFKIPEYSGDEWKLTLLDDTRTFKVTETTAAGKPGGTVTLNFSNPRTGLNEYISAIIEGENGAVYYGRIMKPTAIDRQLSFTLPHDLASGNYKLHVFSEQCNGDYQTDYASRFQTVELTVEEAATEQFALTPGGTYYFDLSGENIPGTINDDLPDKSMHYVPFTYAGAVDAYKLTSEMATTEEHAEKNKYLHSLFVADYAVTGAVNWNILNNASLIFGKDYAADGVDYMLRAPSVGSDGTGSGNSRRGTPQSNEWDRILDKNDGYIKNWSRGYSWGQDTSRASSSHRGIRWNGSAHNWISADTTYSVSDLRFHPVLEVLNPDTLGADGLKAVTLDLGGGKLGGSSDSIQIIVKNGESFTAPVSDGLTRPDGNTGSYFMWLGSDGELYAPGDNVSADVTRLTAQFDEQFTLTTGDTYWFDLSGVGIPGTANDALPDKTMHYVPFTYAGTVDAYKLVSAMATTEEYAQQNKYPHSLFVADYVVTHTVSWNDLDTASLIFGKNYASGGVDYTLRAPSVGSNATGLGDSDPGEPQSNEWDTMLNKDSGYIQNWNEMYSWGQDTVSFDASGRAVRGYGSARRWYYYYASYSFPFVGFRPVLEVLNPGTMGSDRLKAVTLDLGGGKLGGSSEAIQIIVKNGESFTAPASDGLTRPDGNTDSYFKWRGSDGKLYAPGDNVPADVDKLTALFDDSGSHTVTITTDALPDGKVGVAYSQTLAADGTAPITWSISGGALPDGLKLDENTGGISGEPTAEGTATFTVKAENSGGSDTKELSITITKDAPVEYTVTVTTEGNGTASASHAKAVAGTEITLTATPDTGYRFREWQVIDGGVTIKDDKFTMPDKSVEVKAVFEEDTPPMPTDPAKPGISVTGTYTYKGSEHTAAVTGYDSTTMDISGNTGTDAGDYTISVTSRTGKWADGSTEAVTAAWSISKATQEAPNGLAGVAPTTEGGSDGRITGVDATMEYRMAGDGSYTACGGTEIENLSAGNYFVRYAEDNNHFAGTDTEVTVGGGAPLADCTITFDGNGGSGSMEPITVKEGANYILPACGFAAPTDQEFKAWEIGGTEYKVGDSYTVNGDTEIKALWKDSVIPPTTYTVTISNDGNGSGTASPSAAVVGTEITLTATPNTGYRFKEWEVISGGVAITNNKFTMPDGNVEVRAIFAMISQQTAPDPVNENTGIPSQPENSGTASSANTDSGTNNGAGAAPASPFSATPGTEPAPGIKPGAENTRRTTPKDSILLREWQDIRDTTTITGDQPAADEEAEEGNNPFTDVSEDDWFYDDVMFVYENGLMEGISSTQFGPYETQTRGRMAEILWRMEGSPAPKVKNSFADVEDGARYADAIAWIAENDILSGYNKDSFGPGDPITWEQLAVMFYRYAQYKGYDISIKGSQEELKDMDSTMDDAGKAVLWAVSNGLIREEADVLSALQDPVSRAEIAAMLHRFIDKYKLVQGMTPNGQMGWITPEEMNPSQTDRSRVPGWIGISLCAALTGGFVLFMLWLRHRRRVM